MRRIVSAFAFRGAKAKNAVTKGAGARTQPRSVRVTSFVTPKASMRLDDDAARRLLSKPLPPTAVLWLDITHVRVRRTDHCDERKRDEIGLCNCRHCIEISKVGNIYRDIH